MDLVPQKNRSEETKSIFRKFSEILAKTCKLCNACSCVLCESCDCIANAYTFDEIPLDWGDIYDGIDLYDDGTVNMIPQADVEIDATIPTLGTQHENVTLQDKEETPSNDYAAPLMYTKSLTDTNATLAAFPKRLVNISTITWTEGTSLNTTLLPWKLYINHASIKNKFQNYFLMRGKLRIKVVVNASPFFYGAGLVSYQPLKIFNPAAIIADPGATDKDLTSYSQRPNIFFSVSENKGGEMVLPFVYYQDWLRLTSNSDVEGMGELTVRSYTSLLNSNGVAGGSIDIQIFAWMEDLELSGPTWTNVLQADFESKPVSAVATSVASISRSLNKAPIIGSFMKTTSAVADGVGKIASALGFSNEPNISNVDYYKNVSHPHLATTEISVPFERLTLDVKNELSIDPKICGVDLGDELHFSKFCGRESFLFAMPWLQTDAVGHGVFGARACPNIVNTASATAQTIVWPTPMDHVARCFNYWRGDIIFRFKVVCTPYHRGRLKVTFDPSNSAGATNTRLTEIYSKIVDISDESEFEFRCPYIQPSAYLDTATTLSPNYGEFTNLSGFPYANGVISVNVFTKLTAPVATSDVKILVFVRGAENLQFADPIELPLDTSYYTAQSDVDIVPISVDDPHLTSVYVGEKITSIRQLMRRMCFQSAMKDVLVNDPAHAIGYHAHLMARRPRFPGYDLDGPGSAQSIVTPPTTKSYNFVSWNYMTWFAPCFIGERGSVNWLYNIMNNIDVSRSFICRSDVDLTTNSYSLKGSVTGGSSELSSYALDVGPDTLSGVAETSQKTQATIAVNVPMYSKYKFMSSSPGARTIGISADDSRSDSIYAGWMYQPNIDPNGANGISFFHVGAGIDYTLFFFLNVPVRYSYTSTPQPVV